jgi:hypothetical protein
MRNDIVTKGNNFKHGYHKTSEYRSWQHMKARCTNPNNDNYRYYGGRGIMVCDRWMKSFADFIVDMGLKPSKEYSLDRIDNNGNYEPSNCKWSSKSEQLSNRREYKIKKELI